MSSETTDLRVSVQETESWGRRLSITVHAERVQRTRTRITSQIARNARLPGFRKGKLPSRILEQRFGPAIDQETLDRAIQDAYRDAIESQGLTPISQGKVENIQYARGADLSFDVEFEVQPRIELSRLSGFKVQRPSADVGEDDVDDVIERLRDERALWRPFEEGNRPDLADQVTVEITPLDDDDVAEPRSYRFVLGEEQAIPAVEEAIMTLLPGEQGEFDIRFPDDFADEDQRGKERHLRIKVLDAHRKELPEVDDEFARSVGDFDSVDALRARILEDLRKDAERRAERQVRNELIDRIIEANRFDVPASMVERSLDYMLGETAAEQEQQVRQRSPEQQEQFSRIREGLRPQAERSLRQMLVVERIAELEGLNATQDEIDERVEEIARTNNRSPSEVWIELEKTGQLNSLERDIMEGKVFDYLKSQNTVNPAAASASAS